MSYTLFRQRTEAKPTIDFIVLRRQQSKLRTYLGEMKSNIFRLYLNKFVNFCSKEINDSKTLTNYTRIEAERRTVQQRGGANWGKRMPTERFVEG